MAIDFGVLAVPARIADLGFRVGAPRDWSVLELPEEQVDFASPAAFFPLLIVAAPGSAAVLTVAARPGFEDGTLQDWSLFLLDTQGIRPTAFGAAAIGDLQGLAGVGEQEQDGTELTVRFAFVEDGGRLVHLGLMAPAGSDVPVDAVWEAVLGSFVLDSPQGQNVPVGPGMGMSPERVEPQPEPAADAEEEAPEEVVATEAAPTAAPRFSEEEMGFYAKAEDGATLDPEHPVNARLREQGVGFVPRVLELDADGLSARLGAGGIGAVIRVALGWHVIDDGRRTMVLDPDGKVQISLGVLRLEGRSVEELLDELQEEAEASYPNPEFLRAEQGRIRALAIRGIAVNGEPVEQIHMLTEWADDSAMLRARVTCDPPSMRYAADYADLILNSAEYGEREERPAPTWQERVEALEGEGRLEEAEGLIRESVPSLHFAIATAEMYRRRWLRLEESDPAGAAQARERAAQWARTYASFATSGGEGVALSRERDEFLASLGMAG